MKVNRQIQGSYNWVYGSVVFSSRMLNVIVRDGFGKQIFQVSSPLVQFEKRLRLAADELRTLQAHLELPAFGAAADAVNEAGDQILASIEESEAGQEVDARSNLRTAYSKLQRIKILLDSQTAVKYRLWIINPWRYYPRRIAQTALPPRRDIKKRDA